ncbi:MAG: hypothetical protein U1F34_04415 [Gammaproteobacteria bacterium]
MSCKQIARRLLAFICVAACTLWGATASAITIDLSTGVAAYKYLSPGSGGSIYDAALMNPSAFPVSSPYITNLGGAKWISQKDNPNGDGEIGDYIFFTYFDLTGLDPSTASITGKVRSDNGLVDVNLNGTTSAGVSSGSTFNINQGSLPTINITSGFLPGQNVLVFKINNEACPNCGIGGNPVGLLSNVQLTATAVPVPPAAWLFGSAVLGLSGFGRRKSSAA